MSMQSWIPSVFFAHEKHVVAPGMRICPPETRIRLGRSRKIRQIGMIIRITNKKYTTSTGRRWRETGINGCLLIRKTGWSKPLHSTRKGGVRTQVKGKCNCVLPF